MGRYTVELRELIEQGFDLGLKNYPIWDEKHREELNQKIINHYKYREIGFETPGRFKDELNIKMNEIMPYYIKLYATTLLEYNPLDVVDYTEEYTLDRKGDKDNSSTLKNLETGESQGKGTVTGESTVTSHADNESNSTDTANSKGKNVDIDTPQTPVPELSIDNFKSASKINLNKNENTATNKTTNTQDSTSTSNDDTTTTTESTLKNTMDSQSSAKSNESILENYIKHVKGNYTSVSFQALIQKEREIIIDIDMKIVRDLNELFMLVY